MAITDELAKLADLRDRDALSEAEYTRAKFQLLNGDVASPPAVPRQIHRMARELARSMHDRVFGGVCGGLGKQTQLPSWVWRALFVICLLCFGIGLIPYIVLWIIMPNEQQLADETEYSNS